MKKVISPDTLFQFSMHKGSSEYTQLYIEFTERQRNGEHDAYYSRSFMPDWMKRLAVTGQYDDETGMIYAVRLECEFNGENGTKDYAKLCKIFTKTREDAHRGLTFGQLAYYFGKALGITEIVLNNADCFGLRNGCYLIDETIKGHLTKLKTTEIEFK